MYSIDQIVLGAMEPFVEPWFSILKAGKFITIVGKLPVNRPAITSYQQENSYQEKDLDNKNLEGVWLLNLNPRTFFRRDDVEIA